VNDPIYGPDRSITFYAAAEREQQCSSPTEGSLTAWAVVALLFVLATIMLGGCP